MCGIVGFAGARGLERETLESMRDTLRHRGPDDSGLWLSEGGEVGLAHRRLSIIDLSPLGHQPMADPAGHVQLAFNGEIYNFRELRAELEREGVRFRSESDTEVLIHAYLRWGERFIERLNGMFALAMYDQRSGDLYLARDRAGEKPLFCWRDGGRMVFASELKALFAFKDIPRRLDHDAAHHYFAYGYVSRGFSLVEGVEKIIPGHIVRFRPATGEWHDRAYWNLPEGMPGGGRGDADELERELETLIEDAVRRQLVADVPVAVLLSGGVDSSIITAMAARTHSRVRTFTVSFPSGVDEAPYARMVASHFGTDHIEVVAQHESLDLLPMLVRQYDEPIADSSMIPTFIVSRLIREHATVAVGGDGGDELFGGYPQYSLVQRLDRVRGRTPAPLRSALSATARRLPLGFRGRNYLVALGGGDRASVASMNLYFDAKQRKRLLKISPNGGPSPEEHRISLGDGAQTILQAAQRADFRSYMADDILVKVDRASMLASVEMRAPYLDHRIIELAFGRIPDSMKATTTERKVLLRRLAARLLPPQLDLRRKQGFSIPLGAWFRGEWSGLARDVVENVDPQLFDRAAVRQLFDNHRRGLPNEHRLYALVFFELWRREYGITI